MELNGMGLRAENAGHHNKVYRLKCTITYAKSLYFITKLCYIYLT